MKYRIAFVATGGLTIEADTEEEAVAKFEENPDRYAGELAANGVTITEVSVEEE